jgi:hypothetical protein
VLFPHIPKDSNLRDAKQSQNQIMKKKISAKEKAALALTRIAEEHLKSYPIEEQERMIKAFGLKVSELRGRMLWYS